MQQHQPSPSSTSRDLLCSHLCHQIEGGKAGIDKVLLVPSHFDGIQPVSHSGEGGVIWDSAVQEWLGDAKGQESYRSRELQVTGSPEQRGVTASVGDSSSLPSHISSRNHPSVPRAWGKSWLEAGMPLTPTGRWR